MRPVRDIDPEFFAPDEALSEHVPLLDRWLAVRDRGRPLQNVCAILVQHQLSNQLPMLRALMDLGLAPERTWWLDIPYTAHAALRAYVRDRMGVPDGQLAESRFPVLSPYAPFQHARMVRMLHEVRKTAAQELLIVDDGAYALEALATLSHDHWPQRIAVVEQTTRGFIKLNKNAALQRVARQLPLVDVARSPAKRTLEPPFIGMAVCAALQPQLQRHFGAEFRGQCLVLGYGAIGEQVATFIRSHFALDGGRIAISDPSEEAMARASRRGFASWDRAASDNRFQLVVGCSGDASFKVGDFVFLDDGALLASASSGAVELSRQDFIELADSSAEDDLWIDRRGLNEHDVHADLRMHLVDRDVTFVNAGFPVNFNGRLTVCPSRYIQPTPTMMVAAAVQALEELRAGRCGVIDLEPATSDWIDRAFRPLLGERVDWLIPPPEQSW